MTELKAILIIILNLYRGGGPDHIEFENLKQCRKFQKELVEWQKGVSDQTDRFKSVCIQVQE